MALINDYKILLASGSPRRKTLLENAGFDVRVISSDLDEQFPDSLPVSQVAAYLADQKSIATRALRSSDEILLTADTVVVLNNQILNKPQDEAEAREMLRLLSGHKHEVMTGVSLFSSKSYQNWTAKSQVQFYPLTSQEEGFI